MKTENPAEAGLSARNPDLLSCSHFIFFKKTCQVFWVSDKNQNDFLIEKKPFLKQKIAYRLTKTEIFLSTG